MANAAGDSRSVRTWTVALTSLAFFLVQISLLVVVTALPAIRHDLRASLSTLGWVLNAYGLAFGAGVITAAAVVTAWAGSRCSRQAWLSSPSRRRLVDWRRTRPS